MDKKKESLFQIDKPYNPSLDTPALPIQPIKLGRWSPAEDKKLRSVVKKYGCEDWKKIADQIPGRTAIQCANRWKIIPEPKELRKGKWNKREDKILLKWIEKEGSRKLNKIPGLNRNSKQCRERWFNILQPKMIQRRWSLEKDVRLMQSFLEYQGNWKSIIKDFPGLSIAGIRARFYSALKRIWKKYSAQNNVPSPPLLSYEFLETFVEKALGNAYLIRC